MVAAKSSNQGQAAITAPLLAAPELSARSTAVFDS